MADVRFQDSKSSSSGLRVRPSRRKEECGRRHKIADLTGSAGFEVVIRPSETETAIFASFCRKSIRSGRLLSQPDQGGSFRG